MDCSTSSSSLQSTSIRHVRSVSLPTRSHPSVLQFEEELTSLKKWEANNNSSSSIPTIDTVCGALTKLERLYTCVNDLISLPQTQQAFSHGRHQKLIDELLDRSMMLLDVCGLFRDAMEQVKHHLRGVQSALRRRKGDMIISMDTSFFKKMKKDTKRTLSALKQINNKFGDTVVLLNLDHQFSSVVRSIRDASLVSISVYGSLMSLTSSVLFSKPKATRWSIVSNLIQKNVNHPPVSSEALESHIEVIGKSLECMFRSLIKTRSSLLNACCC